jgi:serine/threonine protein kinase
MPAHDELSRLEGTVLGGRYRIERRIGSGGMGTVYLAQQLALRMPVAIKVLHRDFSDDRTWQQRFVREAQVAARVVHPNVARVLDLGRTADGLVFSVMDHLRGEDLEQRLGREGALPWPQARRILRQTIRGLRAAHAIGVIHRDVKPSNVFLAEAGEGGRETVRVLDFGIAKSNDPTLSFAEHLTCIDKVIGTVEYMPPERILGEAADARSDLYSLGVMMFEMLTGQRPWADEGNLVRALARRVREQPPALPEFLPGVPAGMGAIVGRAMARDPGERFASLRELEAALRDVSAGAAEPQPQRAHAAPARPLEAPRPATKKARTTATRWVETLTWRGG